VNAGGNGEGEATLLIRRGTRKRHNRLAFVRRVSFSPLPDRSEGGAGNVAHRYIWSARVAHSRYLLQSRLRDASELNPIETDKWFDLLLDQVACLKPKRRPG
jgi:hypothetical protein